MRDTLVIIPTYNEKENIENIKGFCVCDTVGKRWFPKKKILERFLNNLRKLKNY